MFFNKCPSKLGLKPSYCNDISGYKQQKMLSIQKKLIIIRIKIN